MSSMKYDDDTCSNIIDSLGKVSLALADVESALSSYYSSNCGLSGTIDRRVNKLSEEVDPETGEKYTDHSKYSYYNGRVANPLKNAIYNISTLKSAVSGYKKEIEDVKSNLSDISTLVGEYESTDTTINGLGDAEEALSSLPSAYTAEAVYDKNDLNPEGGGHTDIETTIDTTDDGRANLNVDTDGDGIPDVNIDINGDGIPDLNIDTDGDGIPDINIDTNGDGKPDLNVDTNGDGIPDTNIDTNGDGKPDLNIDTNGDGIPDTNIDTNGDGKPDLNIDTNGDGIPDTNIDTNGDGKPDLNIDTDGDGKPDKNIDADGDGKVDPIKPTPGEETGDNPDEDDDKPSTDKPEDSDLFDEEDANNTDDGFVDNIIAGVTPGDENGSNGTNNGNGSSSSESDKALFPFLPGSSTNADGNDSDLLYRGLYDQTDDSSFELNKINYNAIGEGGAAVAKGAAVAGAVGLGVSGLDAAATINENRKQDIDGFVSSEEQEEKKLVKTIISSSILGIMSVGYIIASLMSDSILAPILLGIAIAISAVTAVSGLKIGKYIGYGVTLFVSLLTFILSVTGVVSPISYIIVFASFIILSISSILLDLLKGMFDDKIELVPVIVAVAVGLFFGMLKVLEIVNWIVFIILILLTVGGYFLWDKVLKYKIPNDEDDDVFSNVVYNQTQNVVDNSINKSQEEAFDPRKLYQDDVNDQQPALGNKVNPYDQNPFANYNPNNSTFDNAFKNDNNNNNGLF